MIYEYEKIIYNCIGEFTLPNAANKKETEPVASSEQDSALETGTPNAIITFDSVDEITDFVSASNDFSESRVFCNKADVTCESFSGTYYSERDELSLIYKVDDITYRFIYTFGATETHQYEGDPVLENVMIDSISFDLYQGDGCFVGTVMSGGAAIRIIVYTEQVDDFNFGVFTSVGAPSDQEVS